MKNKKWIGLVLVVILAAFAYNYLFKGHRQISSEKADFTITASALHKDFLNNIKSAEQKYLNKTIILNGTISEINRKNMTLHQSVFCSLLNFDTYKKASLNTFVTLKGRCIGFDDLLEQVKLDQCTLIND